jgi:parallel beta-helix repeat protein
MSNRFVLILGLLVLSPCLVNIRFSTVGVGVPEGYPVHNLNTGLNYTAIQEAIDAPETLDGHTIFVEAGTYHEHVVVNKTHLSLFGESGKTIVDGDGTGSVIYAEATGVNVSGFVIQNGTGGVVNWGGFAFISNNTIIHCSYSIYFERSAYSNTIINNTIRLNDYGICIPVDAYGTSIRDNKVMDNNYGISTNPPLEAAVHDTIISGNVVATNRIGIELWSSDRGIIVGNHMANNTDYGIDVNYCTNNKIYNNNLVNNGIQAHLGAYGSQNSWDDAYPSGGNYWSDYAGVDLKSGFYQNESGSDGIGDISHTIDIDNVDHYPLMGPISSFNAGTWNDATYYVNVVSNSSVSHFYFNPDEGPFLHFWVNGKTETESSGFCRVAIPKDVLWVEDGWAVLYGSYPLSCKIATDENYTYLYFTYTNLHPNVFTTVTINGTHVIPEYPTFLILPLFITLAVFAAGVKRKTVRRQSG